MSGVKHNMESRSMSKNISRTISFAMIAAAIIIAGFFIRSGLVAFKVMGASVEVRGLSERKVLSDEGQWKIHFRIVANNMKEINAEYEKLQREVHTFLSQEGFQKDEINFLPISIEDLESNAYITQEYRFRYSVTAPVAIASKDVEKLEKAVKKSGILYEKGLNIFSTDLSYDYTKLNDIKQDMLKEATENARKSAETFTKDSNTKLGKLKYASQGLFTISSEYGNYGAPSIYKNVRVVTRATYMID